MALRESGRARLRPSRNAPWLAGRLALPGSCKAIYPFAVPAPASFDRRYDSMKPSISPSRTARGLPTSWSVRAVLDDLVRLEHVRADLVAEADVALLVVLLGELGLAFLFFQADELGLEVRQGVGVVLVLRAFAARLGGDAGGQVGVADAGLGLVLVLAAGAAGAEHVALEVFVLEHDVDRVIDFGQDVDRRRTTCAAAPRSRTGLIRTRRWTPDSPRR